MNAPHDSLLGRSTAYPDRYDPALLFPIPRAPQRAVIGVGDPLPFHGVDIWNAYEVSWLDARGKPQVALAEFRVPATSPNIVESKSFKLYLGSFNQERMESSESLRARLREDLSRAAGANVEIALISPAHFSEIRFEELAGESIDDAPIAIDDYGPPDAAHLRRREHEAEETLVSQLLKTNCPVTGQPDWASVQIRYAGPRIDREGLLRYIVSFRGHADFHEHCVERIFMDILRVCAPRKLDVQARYTGRGGLDINPRRRTDVAAPHNPRGARQ
jgi:7-cyano-7-deazaguanine reductase